MVHVMLSVAIAAIDVLDVVVISAAVDVMQYRHFIQEINVNNS